jgi:hypothetical protein
VTSDLRHSRVLFAIMNVHSVLCELKASPLYPSAADEARTRLSEMLRNAMRYSVRIQVTFVALPRRRWVREKLGGVVARANEPGLSRRPCDSSQRMARMIPAKITNPELLHRSQGLALDLVRFTVIKSIRFNILFFVNAHYNLELLCGNAAKLRASSQVLHEKMAGE